MEQPSSRWAKAWGRIVSVGKVVSTANAAYTLYTWQNAIIFAVLFIMSSTAAYFTTFITEYGLGAVPIAGAAVAFVLAITFLVIATGRETWRGLPGIRLETKTVAQLLKEHEAEQAAAEAARVAAVPLTSYGVGEKLKAIDDALKPLSGAPWPIEDCGRKLYEAAWSDFVHAEKNIEYDSRLSSYIVRVRDLRAQLDDLRHNLEHYPDVVALLTPPGDLPWYAAYLFRNAWNSLVFAAPT